MNPSKTLDLVQPCDSGGVSQVKKNSLTQEASHLDASDPFFFKILIGDADIL